MSLSRVIVCLLACLTAAGTAVAQETHPFSVHDMLAMERISGAQVSPDGAWVAFTVRTTDLEANRGRTDIWLADVDGDNVRRLTTHEAGDWSPHWCLNGKLFFLSTRSGSSQIWQIDPQGGDGARP